MVRVAQGVAGRAPAAGDMLCALRHQDLLVYMGHGSGEHLLPPPSPPALPCGDAGEGGGGRWRAAGLLMGCSSGRVRTHGAYPPSGALLTYLMAGERPAGLLAVSCCANLCARVAQGVLAGAV